MVNAILQAAYAVPRSRRIGTKVFISDVFAQLDGVNFVDYAHALVTGRIDGTLTLLRCDLPDLHDPDTVDGSEVRCPAGVVHFIALRTNS